VARKSKPSREPPAERSKLASTTEVFLRVNALNGGARHLSAATIHQAWIDGVLPLYAQVVTRPNARPVWLTFTPKQCRKLKVLPAIDSQNNPIPGLSIWPRLRASAGAYFTSRERLDRLWPAPSADKPKQTRRSVLRREWFQICGEIARRCHAPDGRIAVPRQASRFVDEMLAWCGDQGWEEPVKSDMSDAVRWIFEALRRT
jgi:hypothetical protein